MYQQPEQLNDSITEEEDEDWQNEDPNLLNVPELLYKEAASLPLPNETATRDVEVARAMKIVRELILDHNFCLDVLSSKSEIHGTYEEAIGVGEAFVESFMGKLHKIIDCKLEVCKKAKWDEKLQHQLLGSEAFDSISKWKSSLNELLESYQKIRECIPKELLEEGEGANESEKKQFNHLTDIVRELDTFLGILNHFET